MLPLPQLIKSSRSNAPATPDPRRLVPDTRGPGRDPATRCGVGARPRVRDEPTERAGVKKARNDADLLERNVEYAGRGGMRQLEARSRILVWTLPLPAGG